MLLCADPDGDQKIDHPVPNVAPREAAPVSTVA
jgi:hypothetical protein